MNFENLTIERDGGVARLWLDRPEKLNALHRALWDSIPAAVGHLDDDRRRRHRGDGPLDVTDANPLANVERLSQVV